MPGLQLGRKWLVSESALATFLHEKTHRQTQIRQSGSSAWIQGIAQLGANFTPRASKALALAHTNALDCGHGYVGTEHLLLAIGELGEGVGAKALGILGLDGEKIRREFEARIGKGSAEPSTISPTPRLKKVVKLAIKESKRRKATYVGAEHLLVGLYSVEEEPSATILRELGVTEESLQNAIDEAFPAGSG